MTFPKVWLINMVLAIILFSVTFQAADFWTQKEKPTPVELVSEKTAIPVEGQIVPRKSEPAAAYELVAGKTLFYEERKEYVPEKAEPEPVAPKVQPTRQPIFLYGVVMAGDYRRALVREKAGESAEDRWVNEGDRIGSMLVETIEKDRLVLTANSEKTEVFLYDRSKPRSSVPVARADNRIPTVVTLSSSENGKMKTSSRSPGKDEKTDSSDVKRDSQASRHPQTESAVNGKSESADAAPGKTENGPPKTFSSQGFPPAQPQTLQKENSGGGEYEIVQTPFGKLRRKIN